MCVIHVGKRAREPKEGETREKHESQLDKKDDATASQNKKRPVIIHRASWLCRTHDGDFDGELRRQVAILAFATTGHRHSYCQRARYVRDRRSERLKLAGLQCETELDPGQTLNKVRNAQLAQFNFILVVGEKEAANETVNVRTRDNKVRGEVKLDPSHRPRE